MTETKVFAYCERGTDPSFWAEPVNALSNLAFVIVGLVALRRLRADPPAVLLAVLAISIGIGSFLFHTLATPLAQLADVVPIGLFVIGNLAYALRRHLSWEVGPTVAAITLLIVSTWLLHDLRCGSAPCLNGSTSYLPTLFALLLVTRRLIVTRHLAAGPFGAASGLFAVSLLFRTVDRSSCDLLAAFGWRFGSHALWHLMNAAVAHCLFLSMQVARTRLNSKRKM